MTERHEEVQLPPEKILTAIHNNLGNRFFSAPKYDAKQFYQAIESGREIPFMEIELADKGRITCTLAMDHSLFDGHLSFALFRDALMNHLQRIALKLSQKENLNVYSSEETGDMIFHIPGVVEKAGKTNILVTQLTQQKAGEMRITLLFLDPKNFAPAPAEA